ncbi:TPA: hypothetical protein PTV58_002654 [Cronobacter sakazakii]|nr:hypothetical protein [Cronobacter sakazakii]HDK7317280.1 hypothetical protein [Cronobacter sakazakii]
MKDFKGSPAPWMVIDDHPQMACFDIHGEHGDIYITIYRVDENRASHNAHLIAAAPDLLEALQDMLSGWKYIREQHGDLYGVGWDRAQDKAQAAISKALGEE